MCHECDEWTFAEHEDPNIERKETRRSPKSNLDGTCLPSSKNPVPTTSDDITTRTFVHPFIHPQHKRTNAKTTPTYPPQAPGTADEHIQLKPPSPPPSPACNIARDLKHMHRYQATQYSWRNPWFFSHALRLRTLSLRGARMHDSVYPASITCGVT